jgi:hypothetical protein
VPATFLQTSWDPSVAAGRWTEDIGRYAYILLRGVEGIGKTVAISAARLVQGLPAGLPPVTGSPPTPAPLAAPAIAPPMPPARPPAPQNLLARSPRSRARTIAIAGALLAGGLVGLLIARQVGRQTLSPVPDGANGAIVAQAPRPGSTNESAPAAAAAPAREPLPVAAPVEAPGAPAVAADPQDVPAPAPAPAAAAAAADPTPAARAPGKRLAVLKPRQAEARRPMVASPPAAAVTPVVPRSDTAASEKPAPPVVASPPEAARVSAPIPTPAAKPAAASTPSVTQPPAVPAPSATSQLPASSRPAGYVDPRAVSATVRSHSAEARACYDRAVMEHPDLHGRLSLRATIDPSGHVLSLTPTSDIAEGGRLQTCLVTAFRSWSFPAPAGGVNGSISYAFSFDSEMVH